MNKETELRVVRAWNKRYKVEGLKRGTQKYYMFQGMFFVGAMEALGGEAFAPWSFAIMGSRDILDNYKKEELV